MQIELSIVLVAWHGREALSRAERAIAAEVEGEGVEVIVVRSDRLDDAGPGGINPGEFRDLRLPAGLTVPAMRAAGIAAARGQRVALFEDHCPLVRGWLAAHRDAARRWPEAVLGGAVRQAPSASTVSWAVYCFDYAPLAAPETGVAHPDPSGCNISLPRVVLEATRPVWEGGWHEGTFWLAARTLAVPVRLVGGMAVLHVGEDGWRRAVSQGWHHGRLQGGLWRGHRTWGWRLARLLATPLLLVSLPLRRVVACHRVAPCPRGWRAVSGFAMLHLLLGAWTVGESAGLLAGPGRSRSAWR